MDYTTVVAIDAKHLEQFRLTWPTWLRFKPSLLEHPILVIYDHEQVKFKHIADILERHQHIMSQPWPLPGVSYIQLEEGRWFDAQRQKMLSAFVHVPAARVRTKYWLKLDVDTVATGCEDWIDNDWFRSDPAIVAQGWGYTKPADQMQKLDKWVENHPLDLAALEHNPPLNLIPKEGSSLVRHHRIISWCGFFHTEFTKRCSHFAEKTCGKGKLPVPSQDGFLWYCAQRMGFPILRPDFRRLGWEHRSTIKGIKECIGGLVDA